MLLFFWLHSVHREDGSEVILKGASAFPEAARIVEYDIKLLEPSIAHITDTVSVRLVEPLIASHHRYRKCEAYGAFNCITYTVSVRLMES